tara:strand:- start:5164 stop:5406 length:243 start_codon:yes stop_codon:yes gene_type:complete
MTKDVYYYINKWSKRGKKMKYLVKAKETSFYEIPVEAGSVEEALDKANREISEGYISGYEVTLGDFNFTGVTLVEDLDDE